MNDKLGGWYATVHPINPSVEFLEEEIEKTRQELARLKALGVAVEVEVEDEVDE